MKKQLIAGALLFIATLAALPAGPSAARTGRDPGAEDFAPPPPPAAGEIAARIDELNRIISDVPQAGAAEGERDGTALLREILANYRQMLTARERRESLAKEKAARAASPAALSKNNLPPPPYNLSDYDAALDRLAAAEEEYESSALSAEMEGKSLDEAERALMAAEQKERALTEKNGSGLPLRDGAEVERAVTRRDLLRLTTANARISRDITAAKTEVVSLQVRRMKKDLVFSEEDRSRTIRALQEKRLHLQERSASLSRGRQEMQEAWLEALDQFQSSQHADGVSRARAAAFLEARDTWLDTYRNLLDQSEKMHEILNREEQAWEIRYRLLRGAYENEHLGAWRKESSRQRSDLERAIVETRGRGEAVQAQTVSLEKQLAAEDLDDLLKNHLERSSSALGLLAERVAEHLALLRSALSRERRLGAELQEHQGGPPWRALVEEAGDRVKAAWNFELWLLDGRAVTVRKVVLALFILAAGFTLFRWLARTVLTRLLTAAGMHRHSVSVLEKILFYTVLSFLIVFALRTVNIPLSVFTILGGALALGAGFGTRNLLNNFISSFILMAERPVKIGDMIEVDGTFGLVEEIGARCTRIRTPEDLHMLVPNSSFLEKNIVNWTLSDQKVRSGIAVGLAYGSDVKQVKNLLLRAAVAQRQVLAEPEPYVLLGEFGDSALVFTLHFWISLGDLKEKAIIESDLRFEIAGLFASVGIEMAYPQRDVHIDTSRPLEMKVVPADTPLFDVAPAGPGR